MNDMRLQRSFILSVAAMFITLIAVYPQGVTTSSIKGKVSDSKGEPVYSATVVATHLPSGTQYGTITLSDGGFLLRNMKVGGPYELKVSFVGYDE
jgi:hypothetical protein